MKARLKDIYELNKIYSLPYIIKATIKDKVVFDDLVEIISLLPLWDKSERSTDPEVLLTVADQFIEWEHHEVIQPRLERALLEVGESFERSLKHIPGRFMEKTLLRPFDIRVTINLNCFKKPHYIRTKNFLHAPERITRAKEFLRELEKINFDPKMICFNDPYYQY